MLTRQCYLIATKTVLGIIAVALLLSGTQTYAHQPHEPIRWVELSPDFVSDKTLLVVVDEHSLFLKSTDGGKIFFPLGDPIVNQDVRLVRFSPQYTVDHTVFAGTGKNGIYRSVDEGEHWMPSNAGLEFTFIKSMVFSPDYINDRTMYAGTFEGQIFRSVDGGETWAQLYAVLSPIEDIVLSPAFSKDRTLFMATADHGIFKSQDLGATWVQVNIGIPTMSISSLAISPGYELDGLLMAGTFGSGVYRSLDGGGSWSVMNAGVTNSYVTDITVSADKTFFLTTQGDYGVYRLLEGESIWSLFNSGLDPYIAKQTNIHMIQLCVSSSFPQDKTVFLAAFEGLHFTTDGGMNWKQADIIPYKTNRAVDISPNFRSDKTVFAGSYGGGVLKSIDGGNTWSIMNAGLLNTYTDPLAISPAYSIDGTVLQGSYLGVSKTTNNGRWWNLFPIQPNQKIYVRQIAISPNFISDQTLYALSEVNIGVLRSVDGGTTWTPINTGIPIQKQILCILISPNYASDRTLFIGTSKGGVYKSMDGGDSWSLLNVDIRFVSVESIALSPDYPQNSVIFLGTPNSGILRSSDNGLTWTLMNNGLPYSAVNNLAVSPGYSTDQTVFAAVGNGGVYKSTDGGSIWAESRNGLFHNFVHSVKVSPDFIQDRTLFAGTYDGVYRSIDSGTNWEKVQHLNRYEEMYDLLFYSGAWKRLETLYASGGMLAYTQTYGDFVKFDFFGTTIRWLSSKGGIFGMADVFIDDLWIANVDMYNSKMIHQVVVFEKTGLSPGWHTIVIKVSSSRNPLSNGSYVLLDSFEVND